MPTVMTRLVVLVVSILAAAVHLGAQPADKPQDALTPLPTDPRLVTGSFDNGLRYVVRRHDKPPGRASVWLHVATGSLNESERQRGIAHFVEHMAFNGSVNFPPGSVINFFQSLGLTFGVHQNAFTSFDQTVYQLALPDNTPATFDKGLLFLSDVAFRLTLPEPEIERERQVIQEERRSRLGGLQRVFDRILENYSPGSLLGRRLPIGLEETINSVGRRDFVDYYTTWYVPANMTVLVVADMDPAIVVEHLRASFSEGKKLATPPAQDPGVRTDTAARAVVASDPELARAQVSIVRVSPVAPPVVTVEALRRQTVRKVGTAAFSRRLQRRVAEGKAPFQSGSGSVTDQFRAIRLIEATASSDPAKWRQSLAELAVELRRASLHGFTAQEVDDVRRQLLAQAERAVETEPTLPAQALLNAMNDSIADGEPIMSAAQQHALMRDLLPTITPQEVSATFARLFDPGPTGGVLFILQIPSTADVPAEDELVSLGRAALNVSPEDESATDRPAALMAAAPTPGDLVEQTLHEPSDVWSGWLSNNTRFHFRHMDYRKDTVGVTILLAGGEIQETAATRGISEAAALAWGRPATSTLTSTNIRDLMMGRKVNVAGRAGVDTMAISIVGSPADLEAGLQLAHLMLTDPIIEQAAFDQWKAQQKQLLTIRGKQIEFVFVDLATDTLYPKGEARVRPLTAEQIDALTRDAAQAWLRNLIDHAPIEVTVVGDIDREQAAGLIRTYLGSLPPRTRISDTTLDELRVIRRPIGPIHASAAAPTQTDKAMVLSGFFGCEDRAVDDGRFLTAAARILTTRMIQSIREEKQLVYSIGVQSNAALEFPGYGTVAAFSSTAPGKVAALTEAIAVMYADFAARGPTEDEMGVMKKQMATMLDERMREPSYWSRAISGSTYRGWSLQEPVDEPAAFAAMTAEQVRDAFARYYKPEAMFDLSVSPAPAPDGH
jgi:zinc protease